MLLWETRNRVPSAAPVLVLHDEIVVEVDAAEAEVARAWLVDRMEQGMKAFLTRVPVVVDSRITLDWAGTPLPADSAPEGARA
jgi:DNA polymerase-1